MNETTKAYSEKIRAELQKAKSQIDELAARSKAEDEQVAMELVSQLKHTHHKIEEKHAEIETAGFEEMEQEQAEIDAGIDKLRAGLAELDRRLKPKPRRKAG
jgi:uncharacterized phage infection (PIP) family protein YhgE